MPKYQITASFSLETELYPELRRSFDSGNTEAFEDESSWSSESVECRGGDIRFVVDAEDEDNAERMAEDVIYDGMEAEDDNGITWAVVNVNIEIEAVEPSIEEALALLAEFAEDAASQYAVAATVVLRDYARLSRVALSLEARLQEADERITGLSRRLQEVEDQLAGRTTVPTA